MRHASTMGELMAWLRPIVSGPTGNQHAHLILIGGCSRTGKSTLALQLETALISEGLPAQVVSLDAWLLSADRRPPRSRVIERYETERIVPDVLRALAGHPIHPPLYDPMERRRVRERCRRGLVARGGALIVEGVIALALERLTAVALARIFVQLDHEERIGRVDALYRDERGLPGHEVEALIQEREREEVPFVLSTAAQADVIYGAPSLSRQDAGP